MNMAGYSEKGFKRKLAVQALFGKVFYLSEVSCQVTVLTYIPPHWSNFFDAARSLRMVNLLSLFGWIFREKFA